MDDTDPLSFYLLSITTTDFGIGFWISVVVLVLLLVSSALISGSEAAFFSLSPEEREGVDVGNEPYTETASQLLRQPKDLLAIILIANNFVNVAIVILSSFIFDQIYPARSEEHTSELQSRPHLVCRLLLEKKNKKHIQIMIL